MGGGFFLGQRWAVLEQWVHVAWEGEEEQKVGWEEWEGEGRLRVLGRQ